MHATTLEDSPPPVSGTDSLDRHFHALQCRHQQYFVAENPAHIQAKSRLRSRWALHCPSELSMIRVMLFANIHFLLATIAFTIMTLLGAIREKDPKAKSLRWLLFTMQISLIFFIAREWVALQEHLDRVLTWCNRCWRYSIRYVEYWEHTDCRHCIRLADSNSEVNELV
jgi:hypothetical protein